MCFSIIVLWNLNVIQWAKSFKLLSYHIPKHGLMSMFQNFIDLLNFKFFGFLLILNGFNIVDFFFNFWFQRKVILKVFDFMYVFLLYFEGLFLLGTLERLFVTFLRLKCVMLMRRRFHTRSFFQFFTTFERLVCFQESFFLDIFYVFLG